MRIAVTGATGVLGQEAVEALVAAGHEVTGITRRDSGVPIVEGRGGAAVVADVFDALTHRRPYKDAWPVAEAVREVLDQAAGHFDPDVVAAFERLDHEALLAPVTIAGY